MYVCLSFNAWRKSSVHVRIFVLHSVSACKFLSFDTHACMHWWLCGCIFASMCVWVCINAENMYVWINSQVAVMRLHTSLHHGDKVINSPSQPVNKHLLPSHISDTFTHTFDTFLNLLKYLYLQHELYSSHHFKWPNESSKCQVAHHTSLKHLLRTEARNCCFSPKRDVNEKLLNSGRNSRQYLTIKYVIVPSDTDLIRILIFICIYCPLRKCN